MVITSSDSIHLRTKLGVGGKTVSFN